MADAGRINRLLGLQGCGGKDVEHEQEQFEKSDPMIEDPGLV